MVVLSRESIHKVKTFDDIASLGIDFVQNHPIAITTVEVIGQDGRLIAMVGFQPI
jgi:hypothetical protein